nr:ATP-binding protein [uncultured Cohaesibacter sp.]
MQNDIWDVLGVRSDVEELASELIDGRCDAAVISGPPGSGKTWLARQIAASFTTAGGVSFRGVGDETEANRRLFAMKCAQAETRGLFKPIAAVGKTILNVATRLATAGATGAEEAIDAFDAEKARRKRSVVFLDEDEQTILSEMGQDALRGPVLLIADNLHWWDKDSLTLLRMILDKRLAKAFPFTENIRILAVTTDESYQRPIWFEDYSRHVLPFFKKRLHLRYCRSNEMNSLKNIFDEDDILDQETLDFLFKLSGGHLAIFSSALNYLKEVDHKPNEKELQTLADDMFLERLRRIGSLGELADTFLSAASIVGNVFDRNEISCLLKAQSIPFHETVHTCQQLEFIEERDGRLEFRHDYIRRFFAARLGHKEPGMSYGKYSVNACAN